ncbi:MAG: cobalamin B12-binding domain-containing protein [Thermoanaerobaculaceae bacterium]|nr:cobalamin B12-binding domain-containing protein [Thermoanaerobaculaceae bacterium]
MTNQLEALAATVAAVSPRAVAEFERRLDALLLDVGRDLATYPAIASLIGHGSLGRLCEFNREHSRLVLAALKFADYRLLVRGHVWFLRAYQAQGFWRSFFPEAMLAWLRAVQKHMDAPTGSEMSRVYRFLMENDRSFSEEQQAAAVPVGAFAEALLRGDEAACREEAQVVLGGAGGLAALYEDVIAPAMRTVGTLWEQGKIDSTAERIATGIVERIMATAAASFHLEGVSGGPQAVVACPAEEQHAIGARMVADLLRLDGWDVTFLGANVPSVDLLKLLRSRRPAVLALSVAMPGHLVEVKSLVTAVRGDAALGRLRILLGGPVLAQVTDATVRALGVDGGARDARGAVRAAATVTGMTPLGSQLRSLRHAS